VSELDLEALATIARGLASASPPVVEAGRERVFEQVLVTDAYDVWVIGWPPGTSVGLHDHGEAVGAVCVVDGELTEVRPGRLDWILRPGQSVTIDAGVVHDVANRADRWATSVHVYSPPLTTMNFLEMANEAGVLG
jgi:quercetin dioxygenase-like cupin family protein